MTDGCSLACPECGDPYIGGRGCYAGACAAEPEDAGTESAARRCRSRSRYGWCGRPSKHNGPHAVLIGDDFWFGYQGRQPLGYGHLRGDVFEPMGADQ